MFVRTVPVDTESVLIPDPVIFVMAIVFAWRDVVNVCIVVIVFAVMELVIILDTNKFVPVAGPVVISFVV